MGESNFDTPKLVSVAQYACSHAARAYCNDECGRGREERHSGVVRREEGRRNCGEALCIDRSLVFLWVLLKYEILDILGYVEGRLAHVLSLRFKVVSVALVCHVRQRLQHRSLLNRGLRS